MYIQMMFPCFPVLRFPVPRFQSPPRLNRYGTGCGRIAIPIWQQWASKN